MTAPDTGAVETEARDTPHPCSVCGSGATYHSESTCDGSGLTWRVEWKRFGSDQWRVWESGFSNSADAVAVARSRMNYSLPSGLRRPEWRVSYAQAPVWTVLDRFES